MEENRLESLSKELKEYLRKYDIQCILGHLSFLMTCIANGTAQKEFGRLASPMRQLYYLAGLIVSDEEDGTKDVQFSESDWKHIVDLLVEIDKEYFQIFIPHEAADITEEWKRKVEVAMPTFLSYFNVGPLNYEEQVKEQIRGVFSNLDDVIFDNTRVHLDDWMKFYDNLEYWCNYNLQSLGVGAKDCPVRDNWKEYTNLGIGSPSEVPNVIKDMYNDRETMLLNVIDPGIKYRFKPADLALNGLTEEQVIQILSLLSIKRGTTDLLYYTGANPLLTKPIVDIGNGQYQVFEEKRVLHAILYLFEDICKRNDYSKSRIVHSKGVYLENKIVGVFRKLFKNKCEIISNYCIDGCEQDIMVIWKDNIIIVESKAYTNREPFRNTDKAFTRIKDDFNKCIGYAYKQCKRVEAKIKEGKLFDIKDKKGHVIKTIDPAKYEDGDFYIIVTQESFGQIQVDLSTLLEIGNDENYPWAVRFYDLEVFILTLLASKRKPSSFMDFLIMREYLHGHIICSDECEICGGFLSGVLTQKIAEKENIIATTNDLAEIFDKQYQKGMGFKNERHWKEKNDGKTLFW